MTTTAGEFPSQLSSDVHGMRRAAVDASAMTSTLDARFERSTGVRATEPALPLLPPPAADVPSAEPRPQQSTGIRGGRAARVLRGRPGDPAWVRPSLLTLLFTTAVLYLWDLGSSEWANAYYSAAAQAGGQSWKASFFGSLDSADSITVDKTPASLWFMDISVRIFGLSTWSILVPQALMGVATVGVVYLTVRRWFTPGAALMAGVAMAATPVAALMFRFNNPDALLTLLLTLAAYATVRALERASTRWILLAGSLVGFGFLAKMLQALLVLPALGLVYLVCAPAPIRRRIWQLLGAGVAMAVSAGWWVAIVQLMPASSRPYIGGSQNNSVLELMLGYNGLGRLSGNETGSVTGGQTGNSAWGQTGIARMFGTDIGGQIAWLLPAALGFLLVGLWLTRRAPRTSWLRAAFIMWGATLLVTAAVFSFMAGIFHQYYTVALGPPIAALVGMGASMLWWRRSHIASRIVLAAITAGTVLWAAVLLGRSPDWMPWLRPTIVIVGLVGAVAIVALPLLPALLSRGVAVVAIVAVLTGPASYTLQTAASIHTGSIPTAGPAVATAGFGPGGLPRGAVGPGVFTRGGAPGGGGKGGPGQLGTPPQAGGRGQGQMGPGATRGGGQGMGGLLNASTPNAQLVAALINDASSYTWVAATIGANNAATYQLAAQQPVMAIGGFNGSDPSPTVAQFQEYVAAGKIHYFLGGGVGMSNGGADVGAAISTWVAANFTATTIGGMTVYDLSVSLDRSPSA